MKPLTRYSARCWILGLIIVPLACHTARADLLESLGLRKKSRELSALTEKQLTSGLKEALARGVQNALTNLGRADGFLKDANVRIPLPQGLQWAEKALQTAGQQQVVDEFVTSMNRAAEAAVPAAGEVLGDAIRQLTIADARTILNATNAAATAYFQRTSEAKLQERFLPIIKEATAKSGVTGSYKKLLDGAGLGKWGGLVNFGRSFLGSENVDLDEYVTRKTLDGLFTKIGEEELRIRKDPAARTTELLEKVFGQVSR